MAIPSGSLKVKYDFSDTDCYSGSGNTIYDLTLNGNDSSFGGSPTFSGSGTSKYFAFDGSADYATRQGTIAGIGTNPVLTFNSWVRFPSYSSATYAAIFGYGTDVPGGGVASIFNRYAGVSKLLASFGSGNTDVDAGSFNLNEWYNVAYTTVGTASSIYINGNLIEDNLSGSGFIEASGGGPWLSLGMLSAPFAYYPTAVDIGYFELYNASLDPADVSTLYSDEASRFPNSNLILKFDFADVESYPGTGNTVYDLTGNVDLFGTITGAGFSSLTNSLQLDAADEYITVLDEFNQLQVSNNFTYVILFNRDTPLTAGSQTLFSIPYRGNWDALPYYGIYLGYDNINSRYEFNVNDSSTYVLSGFAATNILDSWNVAAVTYASGTANFYLNGIGVSTVTGLPSSVDLVNSTELTIGNYASFFNPNDGQFTGQIGAFELHTEVLSGAAISSISTDYLNRYAPVPPAPPSIVGGRQFSQGFNG